MASRGQAVLAALLVAGTWAIGAVLPIGWTGPTPPTFLEYLGIVASSFMLAALALVAWLVVRMSPPSPPIRGAASALAIGGIVAGVANFLEDRSLIEPAPGSNEAERGDVVIMRFLRRGQDRFILD